MEDIKSKIKAEGVDFENHPECINILNKCVIGNRLVKEYKIFIDKSAGV